MVLLAVFLGVAALSSLKDLRNPNPVYNVISVNGEGEVFAVPDIASFSFNVSEDSKTVSAAQAAVTGKMDAILEVLKDMGIEEKDIKTTDYSVYPKYTYTSQPCTINYCPPGKQTQDGYTATHAVTVKVRDTEKAGDVLGRAGENGATNLSGITFTVDDEDKLMDDARSLAIKDAKAKAEKLADELGVKLVRVMGYNDNMGMPYYYAGRDVAMNGAMMETAAVQSKAPTLPTGENKIRSSVSVTYEIR